jgi:hypothetical protein
MLQSRISAKGGQENFISINPPDSIRPSIFTNGNLKPDT